jgi:thioredoxin reductase
MGREECRRHGVELVDAIVDTVHRDGDERFEVRTATGRTLVGRRLLLAIGLRDLWPDIPGLEHVYGKNAHVCPDCDGYECRDRKTVVIGSGRAAVGLALNLTTWTRDIIICTNGEPPALDREEYCRKLDALNIPVITDRVMKVTTTGDAGIYSLELEGGKCLDADKLFFKIVQIPADDLAAQLGCRRDEEGQVIVDDAMHTSVRNVYAAGDIVPGPQLAIAAAADGAIAALAIHKSLVPGERKLEKL